MNVITIIGNLTRDPESRTTKDGKQVCTFSVAVNRHGNEADKTDYFRCTVWDRLADSCAKYLQKGQKVGVVGRAGMSMYQTQAGEAKGQLEIDRVYEVEFLSRPQHEEELTFK